MSDFIFISPGVSFREIDLTQVSQSLGVTTLGLIGETKKGVAGVPVAISNQGQFMTMFGEQSTEKLNGSYKYQLPYVANSYLQESNQLLVTRVLGLSGYNAGSGWALTVSSGINPATTGTSSTVIGVGTYSGSTYSGGTVPGATGVTVTVPATYTKAGTTFTGRRIDFQLTSINSLAGTGTTSVTATTITGTSYSQYENMVVGIVRSRGTYVNNSLSFNTTGVTMSGATISGDPLSQFTITATNSASTESYNVSLDNTQSNFISNVIGDKPKGKNSKIYVEAIYPDLINKLDAEGFAYGINATPVNLTTNIFTDYTSQYTTPQTPYVVSQIMGNSVARLFYFVLLSDGNSGNKDVKISIQNVDPASGEFDIIVRDFNDTDNNIVPLESFTRCSMQPALNNYVGKRIGTMDGSFARVSNYILLVMDDNAPAEGFPCGFEGYNFRSYSATNTGGSSANTPTIFYKTGYTSSDKVKRTYLGISERAYDSNTTTGGGINQDFFNFYGTVTSAASYSKTKGFHLDSGATGTYVNGSITIGQFTTGPDVIRTSVDVASTTNAYNDKNTRKFTLVPYGGFDGWDEHRDSRTNTDLYKLGGAYYSATADYAAYLQAINTFNNPDETVINVFATPGINWSDNLGLVNEAIEMIERDRADSIYIIDAPDVANSATMAQDIADLLDTADIDSNYSATYAPYIEVADTQNGVNVFLPPTVEVVRSIAFTDNSTFPWYAPAGITRGTTVASRARRKLNKDDLDTLYASRINPMRTFPDVGVTIWGQKTLQKKESALDRVNIRRLLNQTKKLISNVSVRLIFEQNDQTLIDDFLTKVNPILNNIKRERGLFDFKVVMDASNNSPETIDRNELFGKILLKPVRSMEFLGLDFVLTPTGASFANI